MNIERLRQSTSAEHDAVEGSMPIMKSDLTRTEYVACLQRLYGIVRAWEAKAHDEAPEWMQELLSARRRSHLLEADLNWFGAAKDQDDRPSLPELVGEARLLGALYVMEGSTLGGQLIARHVEAALSLEGDRGSSFFRGHGKQTGLMWKEICDLLRVRVSDDESERVIQSAREMYRTFGTWMRREAQKPTIHSKTL